MITLGLGIQGTNDVPENIANFVEQRNLLYPQVKFEIDRYVPPSGEPQKEHLAVAEKYERGFGGFGGDAAVKGVATIIFYYGEEAWTIKITGGFNENGELRNITSLSEGEGITESLPAELRNAIADFDPSQYTRLEIKGDPDRGTKGSIVYVEVRSAEHPLEARAEHLRELDWEARQTSALSMSGSEFSEMVKDPEQVKAASQMIDEHREGRKMS